jgi:hypothetical protein
VCVFRKDLEPDSARDRQARRNQKHEWREELIKKDQQKQYEKLVGSMVWG